MISEAEQRDYAGRVLHDVSLGIDGRRLTPRLTSMRFPAVNEMKEGRGEIRLELTADLPAGWRERKFSFENHHQSRISAYQVNCLVPRDPNIRIETQTRNYTQSIYEVKYVQADASSAFPWITSNSGMLGLSALAIVLLARATFLSQRGRSQTPLQLR